MKDLLFIDIETTALTGPDAGQDAIIEIAASKVNLETRETTLILDTLIKLDGVNEDQAICQVGGGQLLPDGNRTPNTWRLGDYHVKAGHFADVDFNTGKSILEVFHMLIPAMEGATIAGQNPHFDLRYLRRDFAALGLQFPKTDYHVIDLCSPAIFLHMNGLIPGVSLKYSGAWAGCTKQAHRAGQDVKDSIQVFWKMRDYFDPTQVFWKMREYFDPKTHIRGMGEDL